MTSFPLSNMKKAGKKVYVRRYEPNSSSTISSISDFSSSVADGKWNEEVNRQAGLATKINICSLGNLPPNTDLASWNFDPEAEKKARKKKKKKKLDIKKQPEANGAPVSSSRTRLLSGEFAGMDTSALLKTTPTEVSTTTQPKVSSLQPLVELPTSAEQSGLHGVPRDLSSTTDSAVPCIHGLLIGVLVLSIIGLIIVAYFMATKTTTDEKNDGETIQRLPARAILRLATKPHHLVHRRNGMKT